MRLTTTVVDGMDIQIAPNNFRADPVDWSTVGKSLFGRVHFLWRAGEHVKLLTLYYDDLTREQALRLLSALGPRTVHNKVLSFDENGELYSVPGALRVNASVRDGKWSVQVETYARLLGGGGIPM